MLQDYTGRIPTKPKSDDPRIIINKSHLAQSLTRRDEDVVRQLYKVVDAILVPFSPPLHVFLKKQGFYNRSRIVSYRVTFLITYTPQLYTGRTKQPEYKDV